MILRTLFCGCCPSFVSRSRKTSSLQLRIFGSRCIRDVLKLGASTAKSASHTTQFSENTSGPIGMLRLRHTDWRRRSKNRLKSRHRLASGADEAPRVAPFPNANHHQRPPRHWLRKALLPRCPISASLAMLMPPTAPNPCGLSSSRNKYPITHLSLPTSHHARRATSRCPA